LIQTTPSGVSKAIKRVVQQQIPNMGTLTDISEYVQRGTGMSESDMEDEGENRVIVSATNKKEDMPQQKAIRGLSNWAQDCKLN